MSKTFNPFGKVVDDQRHKLGRESFHRYFDPQGAPCARHQGGGDGYDEGGAYWGLPNNVWAVWYHGQGENSVEYVRADNRMMAMSSKLIKDKQDIKAMKVSTRQHSITTTTVTTKEYIT